MDGVRDSGSDTPRKKSKFLIVMVVGCQLLYFVAEIKKKKMLYE